MKKSKATLQSYFYSLSNRSPRNEMIAKMARECGVSKMTVYRWISGNIVPGKLKRDKLSEITGIPVEELFGLDYEQIEP